MGLREGRTSTTLVSSGTTKRSWGHVEAGELHAGDLIANMGLVRQLVIGGGKIDVFHGAEWTRTTFDVKDVVFAFAEWNSIGNEAEKVDGKN